MIERCTWARIVFAGNLLLLPSRLRQWQRATADKDRSLARVLGWITVEIVYQIV